MTKLKRDPRAWIRRLQMSKYSTWAIVEGVKHDTPFYEGLLTDGAGIKDAQIIQAEDIPVGGYAAGGKDHALRIFDFLKEQGGLSQKNSEGNVNVFVFVDKDDDDYHNRKINASHLIYTEGMDVESEIVNNCHLVSAVANTFSISRGDARRFTPEQPSEQIAGMWSQWISFRLSAETIGQGIARFSQASQINYPTFSPNVDPQKVRDLCNFINAGNQERWEESVSQAKSHVSKEIDAGASHGLVKGKWLAPFVIQEVKSHASKERKLPKVSHDQFITACLGTVDFSKSWANYYQAQIDPLRSA